jgi:predicted ferric reductase
VSIWLHVLFLFSSVFAAVPTYNTDYFTHLVKVSKFLLLKICSLGPIDDGPYKYKAYCWLRSRQAKSILSRSVLSSLLTMSKRSITYNGLDCLKDAEDPRYMALGKQLQTDVPWTYQSHYGEVTVYFGVVVIFLACLKHIWYRYTDYAYKRNFNKGVEPGYVGSFIAIVSAFSRNIGYKPVTGFLHDWLSMPGNMGNFLLVIVSTLYLACYCFIPHYWYRGCAGFGTPPIAIRAGVMATALLPFVYTMSGKSNMITLLTGISYEKLNVLHQFTGVASLVLGLIHTIPFIYQARHEGGSSNLSDQFKTFSYYSGIPPLILSGVLVIGGNRWFRAHAYELFLHIHWMCGIAFFGTMVWHIDRLLGMWDYMWGALAFWAAQLIYRALVKTCFKPTALFLRPRPATLRILEGGAYEVNVKNVPDFLWSPGQHCYLRFVGSRILDNHPFSICSIPVTEKSDRTLKFIVLPKKGLTRKMYKELKDGASEKKQVFVDGPYGGTTRDPLAFDSISILSTGTGVSACVPFLQHVARALSKSDAKAIVTKEVRFIWIVREEIDIEWIKEELEDSVKSAGDYITVDIYVCHPSGKTPESESTDMVDSAKHSNDIEKSAEPFQETTQKHNGGLNIYYFKPDVNDIMANVGSKLMRKTMIVSSGSSSMQNAVASKAADFQRTILSTDNTTTNQPIEEVYLHTETFGW